jgi:hypothetical protein
MNLRPAWIKKGRDEFFDKKAFEYNVVLIWDEGKKFFQKVLAKLTKSCNS